MVVISIDLTSVINVFTFIALAISGGLIFYYSLRVNPQKVTMGVFVLILGFFLIGLSYLFRIGVEHTAPYPIMLSNFLGTFFMFSGIGIVFYESSVHLSWLRKRHEEIESIIKTLKEKYYQQEIPEEELKTIYANLLKELAEIEVKMKNKKREEEMEKGISLF